MNLEPLRRALRAETEGEAAKRRAAVASRCDRIVAAAEAEARRLTRQGRLEGGHAAEREAGRRRAAASRRGREIVLSAQRRQIEALRRGSREAALDIRRDARYPELLDRLSQVVTAQLGYDAQVTVDPPDLGGAIGRRGSASVDYTLPRLAERAVDGMGEELEALWR
jgi:vacuolar-type H+-ATPase subunit E/Vma4